MRTKTALFVLLFLMPGSLICQEASPVAQLKQMLRISQHRGELETDGAAPFHLMASFEWLSSDGRSLGKGKLDELWESPKQYRKSITLPDGNLVEVDNGIQAWRTGKWVTQESVNLVTVAALRPFLQLSQTSDRLNRESPGDKSISMDCVGTEPDLPGVGDETRLALTTYCMAEGNHLIRLISRPNGLAISFNDIEPFGKKYVARSISVGTKDHVLARLHVDSLVVANDFSALNVQPPSDAQLLPFHRADMPYRSGELMHGQVLQKVSPMVPEAGLRGVVVLKLHVDTTGAVESASIISSQNQIPKDAALTAVKQWRYRVSYQGDKLVPVDVDVELNFGSYSGQ
jgi:TonB family protein